MSESPNLDLTYLTEGMAQAEVAINSYLINRLEASVQLSVIDSVEINPPGSPSEGDLYIIPASGATGIWAAHQTEIAAYFTAWTFLVPKQGWRAYDKTAKRWLVFTGSVWAPEYQALEDGTTINWDAQLGEVAQVILAGVGRTMAAPTNVHAGQRLVLFIIQDVSGLRLLSWNAVFLFAGGTAPVLSTGANAVDMATFVAAAPDEIYLESFQKNYS